MKEVQPIRDPEQIEAMKRELAKRGTRDLFLFVFGINTGLRISDMLRLQVQDVKNKNHIIITEKKTGKIKRFRINAELKEQIDFYTDGMNATEWLFKSHRSDLPIKRVQAYKILNNAARGLKIDDIGTHTLRKTFGYHFYKKTKDVALLQNIFNHASPSVTKRYIGINQDEVDSAIDDFSL